MLFCLTLFCVRSNDQSIDIRLSHVIKKPFLKGVKLQSFWFWVRGYWERVMYFISVSVWLPDSQPVKNWDWFRLIHNQDPIIVESAYWLRQKSISVNIWGLIMNTNTNWCSFFCLKWMKFLNAVFLYFQGHAKALFQPPVNYFGLLRYLLHPL